MRESTVETYLKVECEKRGALTRKLQWIGRNGAPDRFVVWPGGEINLIELKAPGKKPSDLQERELNRLRGLGCAVFVLDSLEAVDEYLEGRV